MLTYPPAFGDPIGDCVRISPSSLATEN